MKKLLIVAILVIGLALGGCSSDPDRRNTERRTMTGTALGAGAGAGVGALAGNTPVGAVVGAGAGLAGGYLYDRHQKKKGN